MNRLRSQLRIRLKRRLFESERDQERCVSYILLQTKSFQVVEHWGFYCVFHARSRRKKPSVSRDIQVHSVLRLPEGLFTWSNLAGRGCLRYRDEIGFCSYSLLRSRSLCGHATLPLRDHTKNEARLQRILTRVVNRSLEPRYGESKYHWFLVLFLLLSAHAYMSWWCTTMDINRDRMASKVVFKITTQNNVKPNIYATHKSEKLAPCFLRQSESIPNHFDLLFTFSRF